MTEVLRIDALIHRSPEYPKTVLQALIYIEGYVHKMVFFRDPSTNPLRTLLEFLENNNYEITSNTEVHIG